MNRHVLCSQALRCAVPILLFGGLSLQASIITVPTQQTLTSADGLTNSNYSNLTIKIDVAAQNEDQLRYTYAIKYGPGSGFDNQGLSHFIVELSDAVLGGLDRCTVANGCFVDFSINGGRASYSIDTYTASGPGKSNPSLPGSVYGVKFDLGNISQDEAGVSSLTLSFLSNRVPVYGTIYGKSGKGYFYSENAIVPDTQIWTGDDPGDPGEVPEPGTYALLGAGLLSIGLLRRRK